MEMTRWQKQHSGSYLSHSFAESSFIFLQAAAGDDEDADVLNGLSLISLIACPTVALGPAYRSEIKSAIKQYEGLINKFKAKLGYGSIGEGTNAS